MAQLPRAIFAQRRWVCARFEAREGVYAYRKQNKIICGRSSADIDKKWLPYWSMRLTLLSSGDQSRNLGLELRILVRATPEQGSTPAATIDAWSQGRICQLFPHFRVLRRKYAT